MAPIPPPPPGATPTSPAMRASLLVVLALPAVAGAQHDGHSSGTPAAGKAPIPVAALMSAPFASEIEGTHNGRFAWIVAHQGARSVYVAGPGAAPAVRIAHWPDDDGQELSALSMSDDGRVIAFVRGQPFNRLRENPNPTSDPYPVEQAVWASLDGKPPVRVGQGWAPRVSPDGDAIIFQRDSTLMMAVIDDPRARGMPRPLHQTVRPLFTGRGVNQDARWSPAGRFVAFTSVRGTHAFVGVIDAGGSRYTSAYGGRVTWLAPSTDRDADPRWSPDGERVLFVRTIAGGGGGFAGGVRADGGSTFGFMVADPRTGAARELWRSAPGARLGAPGVESALEWKRGRVVFTAEMNEWHHLYALDVDGAGQAKGAGGPRQLTSGPCEVDGVAIDATGTTAVASTNCVDGDSADVDRKHLWRVALDGSAKPAMLTRGHHIEFAPTMAGSRVAYLESEPHLPAFARLMGTDGKPMKIAGAPQPAAGYPAHDAMVMPRQVVFRSADGTPIHGQLFLPAGTAKAPAVIFMHGGPVRQMVLGFAPRGYYSNAYAMNQHLASKGYAVLSVNYRGGIGYGRTFREPSNLGARGAIEYEDIVAGAKFLQAHARVDGTRIGLWGGSYGGYLTALGMGRNPELFKAGVDLHGVHDWHAHYRQMGRPVTLPPGAAGDSLVRLARASSPVCCVERIAGPMLLVHGDDDRNVPFEQTTSFVDLLRRHEKPFELLVLPDEVHGFLRHASWVRVFEASSDFLDRKLMGAGSTASVGGR